MVFTTRPRAASTFFCIGSTPTVIYTLSLHDALPISLKATAIPSRPAIRSARRPVPARSSTTARDRKSTSELQSLTNLVCRLLLEQKKPEAAEVIALTARGPQYLRQHEPFCLALLFQR